MFDNKDTLVDKATADNELITQLEKEAALDPYAGTSRAADDPRVDVGTSEDATRSRCIKGVGFGQALFDADRIFEWANRYLLL